MDLQSTNESVRFIGVPGGGNDLGSLVDFVEGTSSQAVIHLHDAGDVWDTFEVAQRQTYVLINDDGTVRTVGFDNLQADVADLVAG